MPLTVEPHRAGRATRRSVLAASSPVTKSWAAAKRARQTSSRSSTKKDDWPPDDRALSKEQNDKEVRDLIGANKTGSALTTQFPIPLRIAVKYPKIFGKLFAALVPVPKGRPRRPSRDGMASECNERLEFLRRGALLWSQER
jgi:hypothetical protein